MTPDAINCLFELAGAVAVWCNFFAITKDRGYAGTRIPMMLFFTTWGFWNLFFYGHLLQWLSLCGSLVLTAGNCAVVAAMWKFGRKR